MGQPGFDNLSGHIDANEKGGSLALASQSASVTIEGLFDQPKIDLNTLAATSTGLWARMASNALSKFIPTICR